MQIWKQGQPASSESDLFGFGSGFELFLRYHQRCVLMNESSRFPDSIVVMTDDFEADQRPTEFSANVVLSTAFEATIPRRV